MPFVAVDLDLTIKISKVAIKLSVAYPEIKIVFYGIDRAAGVAEVVVVVKNFIIFVVFCLCCFAILHRYINLLGSGGKITSEEKKRCGKDSAYIGGLKVSRKAADRVWDGILCTDYDSTENRIKSEQEKH